MTWLGRKKIAFVPVYRPNAHPPDLIPQDWTNDILKRVFYDPAPTGIDRSLRAYIHVSHPRATQGPPKRRVAEVLCLQQRLEKWGEGRKRSGDRA